jgi:hypothetical protein
VERWLPRFPLGGRAAVGVPARPQGRVRPGDLYGGIHFQSGDQHGRGVGAWARALAFITGATAG